MTDDAHRFLEELARRAQADLGDAWWDALADMADDGWQVFPPGAIDSAVYVCECGFRGDFKAAGEHLAECPLQKEQAFRSRLERFMREDREVLDRLAGDRGRAGLADDLRELLRKQLEDARREAAITAAEYDVVRRWLETTRWWGLRRGEEILSDEEIERRRGEEE